MGCTGEVIAEKYNVCREVQDEYAVESHRRAVDAIKGGRFAAEIVPIAIPQKRGDPVIVDSDEGPREDASLQALGRLKAAFKDQGTVTAGNASQLSDGAAALIVGSEEAAKRMAGQPIARIVAFATSGIEPSLVMMAPLEAIQKVREKAGWNDDQSRPLRTERSFCGPGSGADQSDPAGSGKSQCERRRDRLGAPDRCKRSPRSRDLAPCPPRAGRPARRCKSLSRRRKRGRDGRRDGLMRDALIHEADEGHE